MEKGIVTFAHFGCAKSANGSLPAAILPHKALSQQPQKGIIYGSFAGIWDAMAVCKLYANSAQKPSQQGMEAFTSLQDMDEIPSWYSADSSRHLSFEPTLPK